MLSSLSENFYAVVYVLGIENKEVKKLVEVKQPVVSDYPL